MAEAYETDIVNDDRDDDDFLVDMREKFERARDAFEWNRNEAEDDIRFARDGEQWPEALKQLRDEDNEPCLVINRMPSFIRQVVNEARANRPSIRVIPADSKADPQTAEILSGLIRNIEVASDADVAYDKAIECAVGSGFGFYRVNVDYTADDSFDQEIIFEAIPDNLSVYPDPEATSSDGSDWNCCFIVKTMTLDAFKAKYKDAEEVDFETDAAYSNLTSPWRESDSIVVAEYWKREEEEGQIVALTNGVVMPIEEYEERAEEFALYGIEVAGDPRTIKTKKVTQYIVSGAEVLDTVEWPGVYIPIIPVYGDEYFVEGERRFKSVIRDAKDAQREHNYWRSQAAATIALAPKVPFIGPKGAFDYDIEKWSTANSNSHSFIEYDGPARPSREPSASPDSGALQQAMAAIDDMKAIVGIYDASLGQRSNETSGVAIRQRQRQGDVATFHFLDNLTRSIRHGGRILIDLIPKVYSTARIVRVLGEDMTPQAIAIAPPEEQQEMVQRYMQRGQNISRIFDITAGKYDLVVKTGPTFATQRELAQAEIVEMLRGFPDAAPVLIPMYLKNADWPGAEEAAQKIERISAMKMQQGGGDGGQAQAQMQQLQMKLAQIQMENQSLKAQLRDKQGELQIDAFEAQTDRQKVAVDQRKAEAQVVKSMADAQASAAASRNPYGLG